MNRLGRGRRHDKHPPATTVTATAFSGTAAALHDALLEHGHQAVSEILMIDMRRAMVDRGGHLCFRAAIIHLLFRSAPAYIPRFVVAVIVNPIDAMRWGRLTANVGEEYRKVVSPRVADRDAPPAIVLVRIVTRVHTATFNTYPCTVFRRLLLRRTLTVSRLAYVSADDTAIFRGVSEASLDAEGRSARETDDLCARRILTGHLGQLQVLAPACLPHDRGTLRTYIVPFPIGPLTLSRADRDAARDDVPASCNPSHGDEMHDQQRSVHLTVVNSPMQTHLHGVAA